MKEKGEKGPSVIAFHTGETHAFRIAEDPQQHAEHTYTAPSRKAFDLKQTLDVVKGNKPLQMLILSAGSDKLATVCQNNATAQRGDHLIREGKEGPDQAGHIVAAAISFINSTAARTHTP